MEKSTERLWVFLFFFFDILSLLAFYQEIYRITRSSEFRFRRKTVEFIIFTSDCQCKRDRQKTEEHQWPNLAKGLWTPCMVLEDKKKINKSFFLTFSYRVFPITTILIFCQTMLIIRGIAHGLCSVRLLLILACLKACRVHKTEHPGSSGALGQVETCLQTFQVDILQAWRFSLNSQHLVANTVHAPCLLHKFLSLSHCLVS